MIRLLDFCVQTLAEQGMTKLIIDAVKGGEDGFRSMGKSFLLLLFFSFLFSFFFSAFFSLLFFSSLYSFSSSFFLPTLRWCQSSLTIFRRQGSKNGRDIKKFGDLHDKRVPRFPIWQSMFRSRSLSLLGSLRSDYPVSFSCMSPGKQSIDRFGLERGGISFTFAVLFLFIYFPTARAFTLFS